MSDDEGFLARWSRRKRDPAQAKAEDARPAEAARTEEPAPATDVAAPGEASIDLASLPPIESIGPASDVSAFLAPGVPPALTRAALRRAWSSDPEIRDFIGLVENAWDFNAPDGEPSFGSLSVDEARRLLAQATGTAQRAAESQAGESSASGSAEEQAKQGAEQEAGKNAPLTHDEENIATQQESAAGEYKPMLSRPGHGGAVPE